MSSSAPSGDIYARTVAVFDRRDDPAEPLTAPEVAEELDCARRTVYKRLEKLVERDDLETKKVGARGRVWWRPAPDGENARGVERRREEPGADVEVLERIADGFYGLDDRLGFTHVNDHAEDRLGLEESAVLGHDVRDELHLTDEFEAALHEARETREPVFLEEYHEPLDAWFENAICPSETGVSVYFRDVSERKRLERDLRTGKERFRVALANSPLVAFRLDTDLRYTWIANPHEDFDAADVIGKRDDELLAPEPAEAIVAPKRKALETGERVREEVTYELPSGEVSYDLTVEPLRDEAGDVVGLTAASLDVTERQRAEKALHDSEERLRLALDAADLGVWELDLHEESSVRSPQHDRIFGYDEPLDDWSFARFLEHVHPDDRERVEQGFRGAFEAGEWAFDCRIVRADDAQRWITAHGEFYYDDEGDPVRAVGVVQDVTERKERKRELEESRNRYRTLVENFPNGAVALVDDDLRYTAVGGTPVEEADATVADLEGGPLPEILPPELADVLVPRYVEALDGERSTFESTIGDHVYQFRILPVRNDDGDVFAAIGMSQDVTRRVERERELARFEQAVESSGHAIYTVDPDGRITFVNSTFEELTGYSATEAVGRSPRILQSDEHDEAYHRRLWETVLAGDVWEEEIVDRRKDGELYVAEQTIAPITSADGEVEQFVAVQKDVTRRKEREEELAALNRLNEIVQEVTHLAIESSTREEIERIVCGQLGDSESYSHAWIGHVDRYGKELTPQTAGDGEDDLSDCTVSLDDGEHGSTGPIGRAIQTHDVQVTRDGTTDPVFDRWNRSRDATPRSKISIPITFEERVYGVLTVYAARERAFDEREQRIIGQLGGIVGHAITSLERKRALLEDRVNEVTLQSDAVEQAFVEKVGDEEVTVTIDRTIPLPDGETISYYTVEGLDPGTFIEIVREFHPDADVRLIEQAGSRSRIEMTTAEDTFAGTITTYGGRIVEPILRNGEFGIVVQLPRKADLRQFGDALGTAYPDVEFVSRREVTRQHQTIEDACTSIEEELTERQRTALEVAYYAGFFNWPRDTNGEELAERLGVTPSTVHHHLRHGEYALLSAFFDSDQESLS